ncbi:MAG: pirin family protein [Bacteroidota bacterium]
MSKILALRPLGFPWETQDPFLFCAYHRDEYPAGNTTMGVDPEHLSGRNIGQDFTIKDGWRMYHGSNIPGFPYHPHRGFETITINKEGAVDHSDSLGAAGRFMAGDVQWMTAGKGIQHSEMFPLLNEDKGNPLKIFQIWLNLPKVSKFVEPHFKMLWKEDIPVVEIEDDNGNTTIVDVIAGKFGDTQALDPTPDSWAANPNNAVGVFTVKMESKAVWTLPATLPEASRTIFFYKGSTLEIDNREIAVDQLAYLAPDQDIEIKNGTAEGFLLILEGKPINEPVAKYGPFVMNTQEEIQQAFSEYQRTEFGGWPWDEREVVHPRDKGRFALHDDGREEIR